MKEWCIGRNAEHFVIQGFAREVHSMRGADPKDVCTRTSPERWDALGAVDTFEAVADTLVATVEAALTDELVLRLEQKLGNEAELSDQSLLGLQADPHERDGYSP